eukprot:15286442-Alexandrium_andersonii.AAC.1
MGAAKASASSSSNTAQELSKEVVQTCQKVEKGVTTRLEDCFNARGIAKMRFQSTCMSKSTEHC